MLCHDHSQVPGERISDRDIANHNATLCDAQAQPHLYGRDAREEAGDPRRSEEGVGNGGSGKADHYAKYGLEALAPERESNPT